MMTMKKIVSHSFVLVVFMMAAPGRGMAQSPGLAPRPTLWFSFNNLNNSSVTADYGSAILLTPFGHAVTQTTDRFGNASSAINFWGQSDKQATLVAADAASRDPTKVKLFGYSNNTTSLPANFTISCWVYVDLFDTVLTRKIFYTDYDDSRFALVYKGADIYLHRVAANAGTGVINRFDYYFGAPASFDAGRGWYQVILVVGQRSDAARYTKLYIGKPGVVKYDATGPRQITNSDVLASNFGGSYAFTGVQSFMDTNVSAWGLGNADNSDPLYPAGLAPVQRMDDLTVWDVALTDAQASALFSCERVIPANQCWQATGGNTQKSLVQSLTGTEADLADAGDGALSVTPNPTSGEVWAHIPAVKNPGRAFFTLMDLNGKTLWTQQTTAGTTSQVFSLGNIRSVVKVGGIYLLRAVLPDQQKTFKIVVE